ncbi:hypothetical protein [Oricola sp.]|uniref:hypothetical protein n=1 Tax=Oricola sp. TaxID=1979950 RepID=UPI00320BBD50|nr:hypothetical protein [Oricola sp.]
MTQATELRSCFVIAPIGEEGSDTRNRSDKVLKHIIRPAAQSCGYKAERADEIDKPGLITSQVINRVVQDELVIADLTEMNPNVFYELAIRHAIRKPLVQIIQKGERIPFDVAGTRTISVDHTDLDSAANARDNIQKQIKELESNPDDIETPISVSIDLNSLKQSENPEDRNLAEVLSEISDLRISIEKIGEQAEKSVNPEIINSIRQIRDVVDQPSLFSSRRQKYYERNIFESMSYIRHSEGGDRFERAIAYAMLGSFFRDLAPWVYEVSMEVYRQQIMGTESKIKQAENAFRRVIRTTVESPAMRDLIENDKRLFMAYRMLRELSYEMA